MPGLTSFILRSGPKDRVSKDALHVRKSQDHSNAMPPGVMVAVARRAE